MLHSQRAFPVALRRRRVPHTMPRASRRAAFSSDEASEEDVASAAAERVRDEHAPSLKYVPGSSGKAQRARAKLLRNASRRKREQRAERRSPSASPSESSPTPRDARTATNVVELRALLERISLTELERETFVARRGEDGDVKVCEASAFVESVRRNEARLRDVERVEMLGNDDDDDGYVIWPRNDGTARQMRYEDATAARCALDHAPSEVWERIFGFLNLRDAVRLAATCKSTWILSQREFMRDKRYESMFGRARASAEEGADGDRAMVVSFLSSERWLGESHVGETKFPKPVHFGVGPSFVRGLIADETTVTSFDREKVKIWYHGARGDDDAGGRLASLFVEKKSSATRGLTALAINQSSIVAGDDGGRLRIWQSDTLEYVQRRAHAIANDYAVTALCGIPATSLVVCASAKSTNLEIWDTEEVASVTSIALGDLVHDGDGGNAHHGATCMSMFGGNSYSNRSYIGGATSRLWAGTTFQKVVGVDLNRATFVDTLNLPESYASEAEIRAIAVNGPLIAAVVADGAVMWDRRAMPHEQVVATFASPFSHIAGASEQSSCIDLEDFALWMSNPGDPGVSMFDIRKTFGPPRKQERWVSSLTTNAVTNILRPRARTRGFSEEVNVGCFARVAGAPGAVIVAPDSDSSEARCSIFSHKNEMPSMVDIETMANEFDDQWRSRRARKQGKPPQPKSRGRYPKRSS